MSVITDRTQSIHVPIKKNSLALFRSPKSKIKSKQAGKIVMLKNDVSLFSRLYIVMQHRDCDMSTFFKHENHPYPPSLSDSGKLRLGKKSDLLKNLDEESHIGPPTSFDVKALDGAAVVHLLPMTNITTFDEYADNVFIPHLISQLHNTKRVDVVWDTYIASSLKETAREKRGKGVRRKVSGKTKVPGNWKEFLRDSANKQELFGFLSEKVASPCVNFPDGKSVFITSGQNVVARGANHYMLPCDHEEADTRLLIHIQDSLETGSTTCLVRTVDTDVLVILISKFHDLVAIYPSADIWIAFGTGKDFVHLHVNSICHRLGKERSVALPGFHSFTGCDTTSGFFGKGKKVALETWNSLPEVTQTFSYMALNPYKHMDLDSQHFQILEHFTVLLYDKTSSLESVNEVRRVLFCQRNKTMENIPPTQDALIQHTKRAAYQTGIWATSLLPQQNTPTPEGWGWTWEMENQSWFPVWTTLPISSKACNELVKCGCKSKNGCSTRCACKKVQWRCTELCSCTCQK